MSSNEIIERLVVNASVDPLNPDKNLVIATEYEKLGQTASAVSFYLRAAEYGYNSRPLTVYSALLRISLCIEGQKNRQITVSNVLLQALAYIPNRPEAYLLMSRFHERSGNWQEAYTFASLGLEFINKENTLPIHVDYPGDYSLLFQKAVAAWWVGRRDESIEIMAKLSAMPEISPEYSLAITSNLERMRSSYASI
jgi:tetratricopeptide (TPR) repeat protein